MGSAYVIFGKTFQPHHISLMTLGAVGAGLAAMKLRGEKPTAPPINAGSADEEKFINDFIKQAESAGNADDAKKH